jgi:hypothetical protein
LIKQSGFRRCIIRRACGIISVESFATIIGVIYLKALRELRIALTTHPEVMDGRTAMRDQTASEFSSPVQLRRSEPRGGRGEADRLGSKIDSPLITALSD